MICTVCNKPLNEEDTVEDEFGSPFRMHKGCLTKALVGDTMPPDYKPAVGRVSMPPAQDFASMRPVGVDENTGQYIWPDPQPKPARKATKLQATPPKQPACVICGRQASAEDRHVIRGVTLHAHGRCIAALERSLRDAQAQAAIPHHIPVDAQANTVPQRKGRTSEEAAAREFIASLVDVDAMARIMAEPVKKGEGLMHKSFRLPDDVQAVIDRRVRHLEARQAAEEEHERLRQEYGI